MWIASTLLLVGAMTAGTGYRNARADPVLRRMTVELPGRR